MARTDTSWVAGAPRPEIAPQFDVAQGVGPAGEDALEIRCGADAAACGSWQRRLVGIQPENHYHLLAHYLPDQIAHERRCIGVRVDWRDRADHRVGQPDYALDVARDGPWRRVERLLRAPVDVGSALLELSLAWCPGGSVRFAGVDLVETEAPHARTVRVASVYHRPKGVGSPKAAVSAFAAMVERTAPLRPDLVCLPEGITVVGTDLPYAHVAEPVPGPTTAALGELARRLNSHIVAGLYERSGAAVYNTAVLLGRDGALLGRYRKTHLPREEVEGGLTPGSDYPVFRTDFGTVGLLICWDIQFPEPARAMGLQGAEMLLVPIWGGSEVLLRARAVENHLHLVTAGYDIPTMVIDPVGTTIAQATEQAPVAFAEIDLEGRWPDPWLGDMRTRTWRERRPDIPMPDGAQTAARS